MTELERLLAVREMTRRDLQQGYFRQQLLMAELVAILTTQARAEVARKRRCWWYLWQR